MKRSISTVLYRTLPKIQGGGKRTIITTTTTLRSFQSFRPCSNNNQYSWISPIYYKGNQSVTGAKSSLLIRGYATSYPEHQIVGLPALSPTMESGTIAKWLKEEGDKVAPGDIICQVETDKAVVDFESQDDFILAKRLVNAGVPDVKIGNPIFVSVEDESLVASFKDFKVESSSSSSAGASPKPSTPEPKAAAPAPAAPKVESHASTAAPTSGSRVFASPLAKKTARENGVSLDGIAGSGPRNRIINSDVVKALQQGGATKSDAHAHASGTSVSAQLRDGEYVDLVLSKDARQRAEELAQQKLEVPHYNLSVDLCLDRLLETRKALNTMHKEEISVTDFIVRAVSLAMKRVPSANAAYMGTFIRQYNVANIGLSVIVDGQTVVPVIRSANRKGLLDINKDIKDFVDKASKGEITEAETSGATFTISNMGMYNVASYAGIVGKGQTCALGLGSVETRVVPNQEPGAAQIYKYSKMMTVTLAADHRVVDGAVGAEFLQALKTYVEEPLNTLL